MNDNEDIPFKLLRPGALKTEPYPGYNEPGWGGSPAFRTWFSKAASIVMTLLLLAIMFLFFFVQSIRTNTNQQILINREAGYKNRAISCAVLYTQGYSNVSSCEDPLVKKYMPTK